MGQRNIFMKNELILRMPCHRVESFDSKLWQLLDDMHETLKLAEGCGLAANQVGIRRQVFVIHNGGKCLEFINPVITLAEGEIEDVEGCLSFPGKFGRVKRPAKIEVTAQDRAGEEFLIKAEALEARIICHETDHLAGRLFVDIALDLEQTSKERY